VDRLCKNVNNSLNVKLKQNKINAILVLPNCMGGFQNEITTSESIELKRQALQMNIKITSFPNQYLKQFK